METIEFNWTALLFLMVLFIPFWLIFRRAGLGAWWSLAVFIPHIGPIACLVLLAASDWKLDQKD